jgi:23S rRNA (adenine2503-C2)-methyltransferase
LSLADVRSLLRDELAVRFRGLGEPGYRADQVLRWLYRDGATSWETMTNLPRALRELLAGTFSLKPLELVTRQGAVDSTQKFLWRLADGALVESVLIPANPALYGEASDRHTLCVSTQVGCAYGCRFCASGLEGWKRDLGVHEIVDQVLAIERLHREQVPVATGTGAPAAVGGAGTVAETGSDIPRPEAGAAGGVTPRLINNLVIMGMGEPLANYGNLMKALAILNAPWGLGIGARRITISTSGLAPRIRQLADEAPQYRLAISLHGATDEVRGRIMPINRKHPLAELTAACEYYVAQKGKMVTLEYILIAGVNDGMDQTAPLAALARRLHAKVNLIPYNQVEGLSFERPSEASCEAFLAGLERRRVIATLRIEKGHDIDAACGQLRLRTAEALRSSGGC